MKKEHYKNLIKQAFSKEQLKEMNVPENEIDNYLKFQIIPIQLLKKADWNYKNNDNELSQKLLENFKRNGQLENIQVRELENDYYEVINGNHRLDVMKILNRDFIVCYNHGRISLNKAKRITIETNETKFSNNIEIFNSILDDLKIEYSLEDLNETISLDFNFLELGELEKLNIVNDKENTNWVGMPEFEKAEKDIKIVIYFNNKKDKEKLLELLNKANIKLEFTTKNEFSLTAWYPKKNMYFNTRNLKYE